MKTIKKLSFAVVTFVALSFSLSSCDMLSEALSKEVEVEGPAIDFSIGGTTAAPMQKISGVAETVWMDKSVDIKTKLQEELTKNNLTIDKVKTLYVTNSKIALAVPYSGNYNFGNINLYIDNVLVATGVFAVTPSLSVVNLTYTAPYAIFASLSKGTVQVKITSDQPKPTVKFDMKLYNTYLSKIGLL